MKIMILAILECFQWPVGPPDGEEKQIFSLGTTIKQ